MLNGPDAAAAAAAAAAVSGIGELQSEQREKQKQVQGTFRLAAPGNSCRRYLVIQPKQRRPLRHAQPMEAVAEGNIKIHFTGTLGALCVSCPLLSACLLDT